MGRERVIRHRHGAVLAGMAALAVLAGCSNAASSSGGSGGATTTTTGPASQATGSASATSSASAAGFVSITEPWDPGHPARPRSSPASCGSEQSTLDIETCYTAKAETTDVTIDAVQLAKYEAASASGQASILAEDKAWLAARGPVCSKAFNTGGTLDQIVIAQCILAESTARLDAVRGITPPEAKLKSTDNIDPDAIAWYTTPEGSRIGELDTQGDQTGGVVISWIIIGGADGFVVNPKQFYYQDGSFIDQGVILPPIPVAFHRVGVGQTYQFGIDYSKLRSDPNNGSGGGFEYAPGTPVAIWH
ncbi:MAG: lysozyme inhibitor LprI family protein [Streptosporangiaceae bacterium]